MGGGGECTADSWEGAVGRSDGGDDGSGDDGSGGVVDCGIQAFACHFAQLRLPLLPEEKVLWRIG